MSPPLVLVDCSIRQCVGRTAGSIILKLSHGYDVREGTDPIVSLVNTATEQFSLSTAPGAFLVDVFPLLRYVPSWMPGAGFQTKAQEWKKVVEDMADVPHEFVKQRMVRPSYILRCNVLSYVEEGSHQCSELHI